MKREVVFYYQLKRIISNNITLYLSSSCGREYRVAFYTHDNITRASFLNDVPLGVYTSSNESLIQSSEFYANVVAVDNANEFCAGTEYLLNITSQGD